MKKRLDINITLPGAVILFLLKIVLLNLPILACITSDARAGKPVELIATTPDVKPVDDPETFGPDTLWEKINGQAEFYLSAGFKSLQSQMYVASDNADMLIDINIYDMGNPANAFSVFSMQKREEAVPIDVALMAYQTENAVYLVHGPFYVEIISMVPMGAGMILLNQLARQFIKDTPVHVADMDELTLFPKENQIKGSANMIPRDAFGFDQLNQVYTMTYQLDQDQVIAYISKRNSPADATKLINGLYAYYKDFGANDVKMNTSIKGARIIEIMGTYELMFAINNYFAGIHEAPTQKQAESLAQKLFQKLRKNKNN